MDADRSRHNKFCSMHEQIMKCTSEDGILIAFGELDDYLTYDRTGYRFSTAAPTKQYISALLEDLYLKRKSQMDHEIDFKMYHEMIQLIDKAIKFELYDRVIRVIKDWVWDSESKRLHCIKLAHIKSENLCDRRLYHHLTKLMIDLDPAWLNRGKQTGLGVGIEYNPWLVVENLSSGFSSSHLTKQLAIGKCDTELFKICSAVYCLGNNPMATKTQELLDITVYNDTTLSHLKQFGKSYRTVIETLETCFRCTDLVKLTLTYLIGDR